MSSALSVTCDSYLDSDMLGYLTCMELASVPPPPGISDCVRACLSGDGHLELCERLCGDIGPVQENPDGSYTWQVTGTDKLPEAGFPWLLLLLLIAILYYSTRKG